MEIIDTKLAPAAIGPYSQATKANHLIFISGQLPIDAATGDLKMDVREAAVQSLTNIGHILKEGGSDFSKVLKVTIFLSDMSYFGVVNEVYGEFFKAPYPARCCFAVKALPKGAPLEIEAIAEY